MILFFGIMHFIAFATYASYYSSCMQRLNKKGKLLKIKDVEKKIVEKKINELLRLVKRYKRNSYIALIAITALHSLFITLSNKTIWLDYLYMAIMSIVFLILLLLITWMRGAGTVSSDPNLPGFTRM